MKLVEHVKRPEILEVAVDVRPLTWWLTPELQLIVEEGDRLGDVAKLVRRSLGLPRADARQLVAYWFALGERVASGRTGPWEPAELRTKLGRRYRPDG